MNARIASLMSVLLLGVLLYAGENAATSAHRFAQGQADYSQRLACAEDAYCNDPTGGAR